MTTYADFDLKRNNPDRMSNRVNEKVKRELGSWDEVIELSRQRELYWCGQLDLFFFLLKEKGVDIDNLSYPMIW